MNQVTELHPGAGEAPSDTEVGARAVNLHAGEMRSELSDQWWKRPDDERFLSLADLEKHTAARYRASKSEVIANKDIHFVAPEVTTFADTRKLKVGLPDGSEVNPTNWAFGQAASLAGAPGSYLRTLPSQLVADNLEWGLSRNRSVEDVKAYYMPPEADYAGKGLGSLHAITGPTYGRIPDYEVVQALRQIAGNGTGDARWKVPGVMADFKNYDPNVPVTKETTTLFASDRDLFCFLVDDRHPVEVGKLPNGEPDYMFRGFYVRNSEVGLATLQIACMYLRSVCCNRLLWGVEGYEEIKIRHSSGAPDRFIAEAAPALRSFAEGSTAKLVEGVNAAKAAKVAQDDDEAAGWLRDRGLSSKRARAILAIVEAEEEHPARSAWDMANGITALARSIPHQDQRVELENTARTILDKIAA